MNWVAVPSPHQWQDGTCSAVLRTHSQHFKGVGPFGEKRRRKECVIFMREQLFIFRMVGCFGGVGWGRLLCRLRND